MIITEVYLSAEVLMTPERWRQVEELYHAVCERQPDERSLFLRETCQDDLDLRREVELLLAKGTRDQILDRPAVREATSFTMTLDSPAASLGKVWLPARIGPYRILRLVGQGGMGAVYEAEQERPHRIVALKVIKPGLISPELLRRFEQEAEALGRLQHPGIAQIHDAGTADAGFGLQPYFAMELIRGESLRKFAEAHHLPTQERLEIIIKVCEAVHHAHQRGIIHRDLKPGNILVDETGQPKILDFGVARVTDSDAHATRQTDVGQLVGTLAYMSPEQVLGDPLELDTRSDVYALGVILYELLAERMPYSIEKRKLHEALRTIREQDPPPLSSVSRSYRGDIETIVAKALEKDKTRRYASAVGLAADIRRHLADEPITARPASTRYQLQKLARRHKALVTAVAAVFVALVAGVVASTWEAVRARRAELTAVTARQTAQAVNDFLQDDVLAQASADKQAGPNTKPDPDLKVRTALDRAAAKITGKFAKQPLVEASIRQTIGTTYTELSMFPEALRQLERSFELRRHLLGETHPDTLSVMTNLGEIYWYEGKNAQAEAVYSRALDMRRRVQGEEHPDTLVVMRDLGTLYLDQGKYAEAEALLNKTLATSRRVTGEEHPDTLQVMNNLGLAYLYESKYGQAEPLFSKALEIRHRVSGGEHPDTLSVMNNLAQVYLREGKHTEAEEIYTKALEIRRRVSGGEHINTLAVMSNLAGVYLSEGKNSQAEALLTTASEIRLRVSGDENPQTLTTMYNLAVVYQREAKYPQAETIFTKVLDSRRRVLGETEPDTLHARSSLGMIQVQQKKYGEAQRTLGEALHSYEGVIPKAWQRYNCQVLLGRSLAGQKRYVEAEPLLLSGYEGMIQRQASMGAQNRYYLEEAEKAIVRLYGDWGKAEKLTVWRAKTGR